MENNEALLSALWEIWGAVQLAYSKDVYDDKMSKLYEISKGAMVRSGQIKEVVESISTKVGLLNAAWAINQ